MKRDKLRRQSILIWSDLHRSINVVVWTLKLMSPRRRISEPRQEVFQQVHFARVQTALDIGFARLPDRDEFHDRKAAFGGQPDPCMSIRGIDLAKQAMRDELLNDRCGDRLAAQFFASRHDLGYAQPVLPANDAERGILLGRPAMMLKFVDHGLACPEVGVRDRVWP